MLRLLIFMTKARATSTWNTCWTYETLMLVKVLMMAPWCWNV